MILLLVRKVLLHEEVLVVVLPLQLGNEGVIYLVVLHVVDFRIASEGSIHDPALRFERVKVNIKHFNIAPWFFHCPLFNINQRCYVEL